MIIKSVLVLSTDFVKWKVVFTLRILPIEELMNVLHTLHYYHNSYATELLIHIYFTVGRNTFCIQHAGKYELSL